MKDEHMKSSKKTEGIQLKKATPKPVDIEELKKSLLSDEIHDSEVVAVGANRSQHFVRIPARLTQMLQLSTQKKVKISWRAKAGKLQEVRMEAVNGA